MDLGSILACFLLRKKVKIVSKLLNVAQREEHFTRAYVLNVLRIRKIKDRMHFVLNIEL